MGQIYIFDYYLANLRSHFRSCLQNLDFQMVNNLNYWCHIEFHETFSIFFSYFSMCLQKYLSFRDILCLKIILKKFCFNHLKYNFALGGLIWVVEIRICVHIFWKKSYKNVFFRILFSSYFSMYLQKYFPYINVLYLKRILKRFYFDHWIAILL